MFETEEPFSDAIDALQSSGLDRARISVLATGTPEAGNRLTAAGFGPLPICSTRLAFPAPSTINPRMSALIKAWPYRASSTSAQRWEQGSSLRQRVQRRRLSSPRQPPAAGWARA